MIITETFNGWFTCMRRRRWSPWPRQVQHRPPPSPVTVQLWKPIDVSDSEAEGRSSKRQHKTLLLAFRDKLQGLLSETLPENMRDASVVSLRPRYMRGYRG